MSNSKSFETDFIIRLVSMINAWAIMNNYDNDDVLKRVGEWLLAISEITTCSSYKPSIGSFIRSMSNENLAQYLLDIAYENSEGVQLRIPSPRGGYLVYEVDWRDSSTVAEALQEEVE